MECVLEYDGKHLIKINVMYGGSKSVSEFARLANPLWQSQSYFNSEIHTAVRHRCFREFRYRLLFSQQQVFSVSGQIPVSGNSSFLLLMAAYKDHSRISGQLQPISLCFTGLRLRELFYGRFIYSALYSVVLEVNVLIGTSVW